MFLEFLQQTDGTDQATRQPIQAMNNNLVYAPVPNMSQKLLQGGAVKSRSGSPVVIVTFVSNRPAVGRLRDYEVATQLVLNLAR